MSKRLVCRIESVQPPPGQTLDVDALAGAVAAELARLLECTPVGELRPLATLGATVETPVPAGTGLAGRAIAQHIHRALMAAGTRL